MMGEVGFRARVLSAGVLLACAAGLLGAQRSPASSSSSQSYSSAPAQDTANAGQSKSDGSDYLIHHVVRRVIVDVVVSDAEGKPVHGLTARDFSIAEDKKPQEVRTFDAHDFDAVSDNLPKLPTLPANTFANLPATQERGPLYVLLLDLVNMEVDDQPVARQQLAKFVRSKPLGTRFAIFVLSDGLYLVQGFTEDRNILADAVNPKNSKSHLPRIFLYAANYRPYVSTPHVLMSIAKFLVGLPGHKNLIWISASFPSANLPSSNPASEGLSISDEVKQATDMLAQGQIAVYPVDVHGVVVTSASSTAFSHGNVNPNTTSGTGASLVDSGPGSGTGGGLGNSSDEALNARYMTEEEIAYATGGRAFYSTNDVAEALNQATETGGHYYTLTYSPSNQNYDGRVRHISIELSKRGYHLAYRHSYFGSPNLSGAEPASEKRSSTELLPLQVAHHPADSLSANMQHGAPLVHQLLFKAHIQTLAAPAKATPEQMANLADQSTYFQDRHKTRTGKPPKPIQLQTYRIEYTIAARYPALEVAAAAFDAEGHLVNAAVQRAAENDAQSGGKNHERIYRIQQQIEVPTTAVTVRVAVRDVATDNIGALEINLPLAREADDPVEPR